MLATCGVGLSAPAHAQHAVRTEMGSLAVDSAAAAAPAARPRPRRANGYALPASGDTLAAGCQIGGVEASADVGAARRCALDAVAAQLLARLGPGAGPFAWHASRSAFVPAVARDAQSAPAHMPVPARVTYREEGGVTTAYAVFAPGVLPALVRAPAPAPAAASSVAAALGPSTELPAHTPATAPPATEPKPPAVEVSAAPAMSRPETASARATAGSDVVVRKAPAPDAAAPALRIVPPGPVSLVVGRQEPIALRVTLADAAAPGGRVGGVGAPIARGVCAPDGRRSRIEVTASRVDAAGALWCWVRLGPDVADGADLHDSAAVRVIVRAVPRAADGSSDVGAATRGTASSLAGSLSAMFAVTPVYLPTYAVRATANECGPVAARVGHLLDLRGVPRAGARTASRTALLTDCQHFDRLLPASRFSLPPSGYSVSGEIADANATVTDDPAYVGIFQLTTTTPGSDPVQEAAEAIVNRLLKYQPVQ